MRRLGGSRASQAARYRPPEPEFEGNAVRRALWGFAIAVAVALAGAPSASAAEWSNCGTVTHRQPHFVSKHRVLAVTESVRCDEAIRVSNRWFRDEGLTNYEWPDGWACEYQGRPGNYETYCFLDGERLVRLQMLSGRPVAAPLSISTAKGRTRRAVRRVFGQGATYELRTRCQKRSRTAARCSFSSFAGDVTWRGNVTIRNRPERWQWRLVGRETNEYCVHVTKGRNCVRDVRRSGSFSLY
jgi:hypothetical protein